jgi:hypothetical protein
VVNLCIIVGALYLGKKKVKSSLCTGFTYDQNDYMSQVSGKAFNLNVECVQSGRIFLLCFSVHLGRWQDNSSHYVMIISSSIPSNLLFINHHTLLFDSMSI